MSPIYKCGGGGVEFLDVPIMLTFDVVELLANTCPQDEFERRVLGPGGHAGLIEFWNRARGKGALCTQLGFPLIQHVRCSIIILSTQ